MIKKILFVMLAIPLLAAGCNPLSRSAEAGLFKTTNGGSDWLPINTLSGDTKATLAKSTFSKLGFDPSNNQIVYATSFSHGFFKSEDAGNTWTQILPTINAFDFAIHPVDHNILYVAGYASEHGKLVISRDGGKAWEEVFNEESTGSAVRSVAINPTSPNEILIGLSHGAIHKSFDSGRNWLALKNFEDRIQRINWQSGNVFVLTRTKGLFKSTDGGSGFVDITSALTGRTPTLAGISSERTSGVGFFGQFSVSEINAQEIYVTADNGFYKTINGGSGWSRLNVPIKSKAVPFRAVTLVNSNPPSVFVSAGGTVYKSFDGGISFETKSVTPTAIVSALLVDPINTQIVYAGIFAE